MLVRARAQKGVVSLEDLLMTRELAPVDAGLLQRLGCGAEPGHVDGCLTTSPCVFALLARVAASEELDAGLATSDVVGESQEVSVPGSLQDRELVGGCASSVGSGGRLLNSGRVTHGLLLH